jgi:hypothetical protein
VRFWARSRIAPVIGLALAGGAATNPVEKLYVAVDGTVLLDANKEMPTASLRGGVDVELLKREGGWSQVRVTGWIPDAATTADEALAATLMAKARGTPLGDGLTYANAKFSPVRGMQAQPFGNTFNAEVTNQSGKDLSFVKLRLTCYGRDGSIAYADDILIQNLRAGQTRTLDKLNASVPPSAIAKFKLDVESITR